MKSQVQDKFWTRQIIEVSDGTAQQEDIKLWNTPEFTSEAEGKVATISNIQMTEYTAKKQLVFISVFKHRIFAECSSTGKVQKHSIHCS